MSILHDGDDDDDGGGGGGGGSDDDDGNLVEAVNGESVLLTVRFITYNLINSGLLVSEGTQPIIILLANGMLLIRSKLWR